MDRNLALEAVRVTEAAALASARLMGRGNVAATERAGAEAMCRAFESFGVNAVVAVGEPPESEDDLLRVGTRLGAGSGPEIDVALEPLEGTAICATGGANALSLVALAKRGGFLACPDMHMEKIAVAPEARGLIDLHKSPTENLRVVAEARGGYVADLCVAILDRPRHEGLIEEVRSAGVRVKLLSDGDVAAALATTRRDSGIDMLMGTGGAQQGILTAAGMRCAGGDMQARFRPRNRQEEEQARQCGIEDMDKCYSLEEMAEGSVMFACTGVTSGDYLRGVRFFRGGAVTNSAVMRSRTHTVRFIESYHRFDLKPEY